MPNYGDIRLGLSPQWDRRKTFNKAFINSTVGHKDGVSEIRLKDKPEQKHAFALVDLNNRVDVDQNLDDGYVFVKKAEGWIADRWQWNAEGFLYCEGQVFMSITEDKWEELEARRDEERAMTLPPAPVEEDIQSHARKFGAVVESEVPLGRRNAAGR